MKKNYKLFPANLINLKYDENITWLVIPQQDWKNNIVSGLTFSSFEKFVYLEF